MDLRRLELDFAKGRARVTIGDHAGEQSRELDGERFERVMEAAAPLLGALEARLGGACHLSLAALALDAAAESLAVTHDGGSRRIAGEEYRALGARVQPLARAAVSEAWPRSREEAPGLDAAFWNGLYQTELQGWELGRPAPPLARFFAAHPPPPGALALSAGCGRGHEARLLARLGAKVIAVDFAPEAVAQARALAAAEGVALEVRQRDLFTLPDEPERYRLAVEHTLFCAIDPARRDDYVDVMRRIIEPGGELVGLFFAHRRPGGPPFATTRDELERRFSPHFDLAHVEVPPDSVALRSGDELLVRLVRRGHDRRRNSPESQGA